MAKYITISVPQPCSEDWSKMTPAEKGRFCDACKKTVTDFTLMSDAQLASFYERNNGKLCGRFRQDQLDKDLVIPGRQIPWLKYFFTISIPAFLVSLKASAQQHKIYEQVSFAPGTLKQSVAGAAKDYPFYLTGKVTDEKGSPIEAASVVIEGTKRGVKTDANGMYSLRINSADKRITVSGVGITPTTKSINTDMSVLNFSITRFNTELGLIVVTTTRKKKQKSNIEPYKETKSITIFPNPAAANDRLNIKWNLKTTSEQHAEIFAADGTLVQTETITPSASKSPTAFILLKNLVKGFYIIRITDLQTHEKFSKEFIIQ